MIIHVFKYYFGWQWLPQIVMKKSSWILIPAGNGATYCWGYERFLNKIVLPLLAHWSFWPLDWFYRTRERLTTEHQRLVVLFPQILSEQKLWIMQITGKSERHWGKGGGCKLYKRSQMRVKWQVNKKRQLRTEGRSSVIRHSLTAWTVCSENNDSPKIATKCYVASNSPS